MWLELNALILLVVVGLLSAGMLAVGLAVGYWRGWRRGRQQALNQSNPPPTRDADVEILAGMGRAILGAQLRLDALCEIVYQQAARIVSTAHFQIGLFEGDDYVIKIWVRDGERLPERRFPGNANTGLIGWVRTAAQGIRINDYEREWESLPARPSYDSVNPPRSGLFVPLIAGGEAIGAIAIQSDLPDAFTDESFRLMSVLASQAAGAIRNAQLYTRAQATADQLRLISDVSRQITSVQSLPSLFRQIVTLVHDRFQYYAVNIFTYDERADEVRLQASSHTEFDRRKLALKPKQGLVGSAYSTAQPLNIPDVTKDSRYVPVAVLEHTRSELCVPLVVDRRVLGILDVQSDELASFKPEDVFMLESLAGQLALALQEAQTYDTERRQAERINAMAEASRAVVSILDINDLLDEVVDLIADYFGYDRVHLFLRTGDRVVFRSGSGVHSARWSIEQLSYDIRDPGFIPWVARTGQPLICGDVATDERYVVGPGLEDSCSEMTVPIVMGERVLGVFDIQSPQSDAFTPEDATLVQALADTVAVGLRNASLFATEQRRRVLAETLREVSTVLVSSLDLESVLDGVLLGLQRVVVHEAAMIMLRREDEGDYVVRAVHGAANENEILGQAVPAAGDLIERMWGLLRQVETPEAVADIARLGFDRIYAPMQVGGKEIGILAIERIGMDHFSNEEIEIINTFANQAALAIEGAELFASQQEEAWVTTALLSVAESVNSTVELRQTIETLVRLTPMLVGVARCGLMQWDSTARSFNSGAAWGTPPAAEEEFEHLVINDRAFIDLISQATEPITLGADSPHPLPEPLPRLFEVETMLALPLLARGSLVGLMLVDRPALGEPINQRRRMNILSGIAHQSALALQTGRLQAEATERQRLERELEVAQRIQRSFLPQQLPRYPGWQLAAFYRAARQVGGDFYDFIPLRSGKVGIVIADVADKGVPAALFMALCRTNIRAAAFSRDDPVDTLVRVNELLLSDSRSDLFVTVWYGVWDPVTGEVIYAVGGHNPPLLLQADGLASELSGRGVALGVVERMRIEKRSVIIDPGDVLAGYTDGITDALRSDGAEFGLVGLQSTVSSFRQRSAQEIVTRVVRAVDTFTGDEPQFDDLTLIVLKRVGKDDARATTEMQMLKPDTLSGPLS